ncbi:MAG: insulinase family protein [Candidatus Cloacimonetes bacterium]|nr:insulinase family protein [Candidatus Cloacimonadota bacterium]
MKYSDITNIPLDQFCLGNSLCLYANPDPANPIICLQLYIKTGSVRESTRQFGYAHFLEHLVFKSTSKYPNNSISTLASSMGMVLNAYTDFDATCYYVMLPRERLDEGMDILAQMALHADFSEADVNSEKDIIIEEIYQYESDPEMSFIENIQAKYFKKKPTQPPRIGYD